MVAFQTIDDLIDKDQDVNPEDLKKAPGLKVATKEINEAFVKKMKDVGIKEKEHEAMRLSAKLSIPHIDLEKFPVSHESLRQVSKEMVKELGAVCFYATQDEVRVGALDPSREEVQELLHAIEERNHAHGALYVISKHSLDNVLKLYANLPEIEPITKDIEVKVEDIEAVQASVSDFSSLQESLDRKTASDLLVLLLGASLKLNASDLHIEAEEEGVAVRLRLDGVLHDVATLDKQEYLKLVSRIKLVSSLKINVKDKPQDGRFTIKPPEGEVDVRVSTMPTVYGESVVMRLLRQTMEGLNLDSLGLRDRAYVTLKKEIERPNGLIITTGPTGSGKTTTMYAIMNILNKENVKIITLEDPVEYKMKGINQSQVDISKDYTFAKGLKSILRQDPDIAMVGEIRELETAEIAIQASLTGHLILSTIHTNDAAGAVPRFLSMGVKPFLLAPALNCVIGQRLVRKICDKCVVEEEVDSHMLERVGEIIAEMPEDKKKEFEKKELKFYKGKGCEECGGIGYKGRVGIYEVFSVTPEIKEMIINGHVSEYDIKKAAIAQGMVTMAQDGIIKALEKLTSLEEVFRVSE